MVKRRGFFGGLVSVLLLSPLAFCGLDKLLPKLPVPTPLEVSERVPAVPFREPGAWNQGVTVPLPRTAPAPQNAPVSPAAPPAGSPAASLPHWTGPNVPPPAEKPKAAKKPKPAPKKPEAPKCGLDVIGALKGECK